VETCHEEALEPRKRREAADAPKRHVTTPAQYEGLEPSAGNADRRHPLVCARQPTRLCGLALEPAASDVTHVSCFKLTVQRGVGWMMMYLVVSGTASGKEPSHLASAEVQDL
jgi:hypothetical protein